MQRILHCLLVLLLNWSVVQAQKQTSITGIVKDASKQPIPGANVFLKNTYDGSTTKADGKFNFSTTETGEQILSVTFLGYETSEQKINCTGEGVALQITLKEKTNELNTVTISAGAFEASDEKKMVILKPLDIVTTAGANGDVYGALQTLPGTQQIGDKEGLFVRGGDAHETKTIIDGVTVDNPYFTSVPDVPQRGRFSPFLFKNTSFSTGGYSAQYGQAMSSALILESQDVNTITSFNVGVMSVGLSLGYNKAWKEKTSLGIYGGYTNLAPYFSLQKQLRDFTLPPLAYDGSIVFRHKTSKTGLLKIFTNYSANKIGLNIYDINNPDTPVPFELSSNNQFVMGSYKEIIAKNYSLNLAGGWSNNNNDIEYGSFPIASHNQFYQGRITVSRALGKLNVIRVGGEYQRPDKKNEFSIYSNRFKDDFGAAFVEGDIFITQKIVARTGLRTEYSSYMKTSNLAPRVSLAYKTGKFSQVSFAYGDFFQQPTDDYLRSYDNLSYESATHFIANYQVMTEKKTFRIEAYRKNYHDLVRTFAVSPSTGIDSVTNNSGDGYAQGFDFFWRDKKTFKFGDYWLSYSYLDTKRLYKNFPSSATPNFAATHTFSIVYKYYVSKLRTFTGFTYAYATGRPYYNPNNSSADFLKDKTKEYHNLSLNFNYLTSIKKNFTVVVFSITNVLGIENVFGYRYSSDGLHREAVGPTNKRFFFLAAFINIGSQEDDSDKYN